MWGLSCPREYCCVKSTCMTSLSITRFWWGQWKQILGPDRADLFCHVQRTQVRTELQLSLCTHLFILTCFIHYSNKILGQLVKLFRLMCRTEREQYSWIYGEQLSPIMDKGFHLAGAFAVSGFRRPDKSLSSMTRWPRRMRTSCICLRRIPIW